MRGMYIPLRSSDREFTLLRVDMTCCAADAVFLEIRIEAPEPIQGIQRNQWVQVEGPISFQRSARGGVYLDLIGVQPKPDEILWMNHEGE